MNYRYGVYKVFVKKNGILQVDYTNRLVAGGMAMREVILEANRVRLRPVAIGIGAGSEQRASIAVTIIGGQTLCLLLTLLVVPVAYSYLAEFESRRGENGRAGCLEERVRLSAGEIEVGLSKPISSH